MLGGIWCDSIQFFKEHWVAVYYLTTKCLWKPYKVLAASSEYITSKEKKTHIILLNATIVTSDKPTASSHKLYSL